MYVFDCETKIINLPYIIETNNCLAVNGSSLCKNGGVCTDIVNGYLCTCHGNFQGPTCETHVMGMSRMNVSCV